MKLAKFTTNKAVEVGSAKSGKVAMYLVTGHVDKDSGALAVQVREAEGVWVAITLVPVVTLEAQVSVDLGQGVEYRLVLTGSTDPDLWVGVIGT